ncbi:MAG: 2-phosphosulfolactate phosphatase [Candidatus Helarchaeota archaeon]
MGQNERIRNKINDSILILIDVLRASSTITTAIAKGTDRVYSLKRKNEAFQLKSTIKDSLLVGERLGIKIKDFDFGNSPSMLYKYNLKGKTIIFTSSNFSNVLQYYNDAPVIIVGSILNAKYVAKYLKMIKITKNYKIILVQAGTSGFYSEEDELGAKLIMHYLKSESDLFTEKEIQHKLLNTRNGKYLTKIGYKEDVEFCAQLNKFKTIPIKFNTRYFFPIHQSKLSDHHR